MIKHVGRVKVLVAVVAALGVAGGANAFTAANTVPASVAGAGSGAVSGYTVTNVHCNLNATSPVNIDSLTFTVSPLIPSMSSGKVIVQALLSTGGPNTYSCTTTTAGDAVTCATSSPQLAADKITSVTVVAAQ